MRIKIYHIDAFTDALFAGNYAAVLLTDTWLSNRMMQAIAAENNLSETAFVKRGHDSHHAIRWFSPSSEIDFCGHATLAAAFVLFQESPELQTFSFYAKAVGTLTVRRGSSGDIAMTFPNQMPVPVAKVPAALLQGLSRAPVEVLLNRQAYFVLYGHEDDVHSVSPNYETLLRLAPYDVVVSAQSLKYDFVSRYFWPGNGGTEDPVTGSIHAGLAPLWAERLGKQDLRAYQDSPRGGTLHCLVSGQDVVVSGRAVQYLVGHIEI